MRIIVTLIGGLLISYAAYTGSYSYWLEPLGEQEFILQETIGIDDHTDQLIWCEVGSICIVERSIRERNVDPVNYIGVATRNYTVYRLDGPITAVSDMFMDRELLKHMGMILSLLVSTFSWCIVLGFAFVLSRPKPIDFS
jgi:hypothetical protein